jgi:hypothetical protein
MCQAYVAGADRWDVVHDAWCMWSAGSACCVHSSSRYMQHRRPSPGQHLPSVSSELEQSICTPFGPTTATCRGLALRPLDRVYIRDSSVAFSHTSAVAGPWRVTSGKVVVMTEAEPVLSLLQLGGPATALTATAAGRTPLTAWQVSVVVDTPVWATAEPGGIYSRGKRVGGQSWHTHLCTAST